MAKEKLQDLIREGIVTLGVSNLFLKVRGKKHFASIIKKEGHLIFCRTLKKSFRSLSAWALTLIRKLYNPERASINGWSTVYYLGENVIKKSVKMITLRKSMELDREFPKQPPFALGKKTCKPKTRNGVPEERKFKQMKEMKSLIAYGLKPDFNWLNGNVLRVDYRKGKKAVTGKKIPIKSYFAILLENGMIKCEGLAQDRSETNAEPYTDHKLLQYFAKKEQQLTFGAVSGFTKFVAEYHFKKPRNQGAWNRVHYKNDKRAINHYRELKNTGLQKLAAEFCENKRVRSERTNKRKFESQESGPNKRLKPYVEHLEKENQHLKTTIEQAAPPTLKESKLGSFIVIKPLPEDDKKKRFFRIGKLESCNGKTAKIHFWETYSVKSRSAKALSSSVKFFPAWYDGKNEVYQNARKLHPIVWYIKDRDVVLNFPGMEKNKIPSNIVRIANKLLATRTVPDICTSDTVKICGMKKFVSYNGLIGKVVSKETEGKLGLIFTVQLENDRGNVKLRGHNLVKLVSGEAPIIKPHSFLISL